MKSPKIPAKDAKLIHHRWAMHAVQALSQRDAELLTRVFTEIKELPAKAVDTQVKTFGCGAPMQFHDYGFFDGSSQEYAAPMFEKVIEGDSLLLIALRQHDPESAKALIKCQASLDLLNSLKERPIDILFGAYATLQLHKKRADDGAASQAQHSAGGIVGQQAQYQEVFDLIDDRLQRHYDDLRDFVESELYRIYSTHAPERLPKIDVQMQDFEFREMELLASVKRKYET